MTAAASSTTERPPAKAESPLLDIRGGEGREVVLAFCTLLGLVASLSLLETARDALFLAKLPAQRLAFVYMVVAALGLFVTGKNLLLVQRVGRRASLVVTLAAAAVGTTLLYFRPASPALAFTLYVWSALLGSVAVVQFWLVATESFTSAQSKRLFSVISAGGVIGAVAGSALAVLLLSWLPVGSLLLVAAALFVVTAIVVTLFPEPTESRAPRDGARGGPLATPGRVRLLSSHPYLRRVALLVALSTVALLVLDYLFKSRAAATLPAAQLGPFFARYYAVLNTLALLMQVVVASRVVRRVGVVVALSVLPLALLGGAVAAVALSGSFAVVLLAKGADGALRHSLNRVANELLYVPLDAALRDRVKPLVDSVLARVAQAVGAVSILGLVALGADSPKALSLVLAVLAGAWILVALSLRGPYLEAFRSSLSRGGLDDPRIGFDDLDLTSVEAVTEALSSPDERRVLAAMNLLADAGRTRLIPALILYHEADSVLVRALEVVPEKRRSDWGPLAQRLLGHQSEVVRLAAVRALVRHGKLPSDMHSPKGAVRAYLAAQRARESRAADFRVDEEIQRIVAGATSDCQTARRALLNAVVDDPDPRWVPVVQSLAELDEPDLANVLPAAMAALGDATFIPTLIRRLAARRGRAETREALARFGEAALEPLGRTLLDSAVELRLRMQVPRAVAALGTQRAADELTRALNAELPGLLRYRVLRALGQLVSRHGASVEPAAIDAELRRNLREYLKLAGQSLPFERQIPLSGRARASARLVSGLLVDKMRQARERVFRLLQLQHPSEDLRSVYFALDSSDRRVRANALEFVDALMLQADEELRTLLRLVVDELSGDDRAARSSSLVGAPPTDVESALGELMSDSDDALATVAAYHAHALRSELAEEAEGVMSRRGWMNLAHEAGITALHHGS